MSIDERRLRKLDLNLLVAFSVLMRELNVSRAAEKLFIGQSAMSASLARLRESLDDPLFVRVGRSLQPTPQACALAAPVERALEAIETAVYSTRNFDPANHQGAFRFGVNDNHECWIVPALLRALQVKAPQAAMVVRPADHNTLSGLLDAGEIDAAMSVSQEIPSWQQSDPIFSQGHACVYSRERLRIKAPLSLDAYCSKPHVLVSFRGDTEGSADEALARINRKRHVSFAVPRFASIPYVLRETAVIATLPEPFARCISEFHQLTFSPVPFPIPPRTVSLVWRKRDENDPAQRWFRDLVKTTATTLSWTARRGGKKRRGRV